MAREMNTMLVLYKDGKEKNFERFFTKSFKSIVRMYKDTLSKGGAFVDYFFKEYWDADKVVVYATPDHYTRGEILYSSSGEEFMKMISK